LEFVLAFLPWDLGCAVFVVFISGLCAIKSVPPGPRKHLGTITENFKLSCVGSRRTFVVSQVRCIDSRNMSYHTKLLSILIFILLYSDYITFWLASSVSPLVLETGLEYGSSSELKGEYFVVFLAEELLYKYIYVY
jgi:hypothetical protein